MGLIIQSLNYVHPDNTALFHALSCILNDGEKAALVGINGAGKSTLLRLIAGELQPVSGEITCTKQPWYVPQHLGEFDTWPVARALGVAAKLDALRAILSGDTDVQHFTTLDDDWDIESRIKRVLEKWALGDLDENRLLGSLSGGQKTRVFLAAMELNSQQLILLDEPSNHLDRNARSKLYEMILQSKATMLIVSHDRTLLNLLDKTLELSENGIEVFGGNFDFYQQKKMEQVSALRARLNEQFKALKASGQKADDMAGQRAQQQFSGRAGAGSMPRIIAGGLAGKAERSTAKMLSTHEEKIATLLRQIEETKAQIEEYEVLRLEIRTPHLDMGQLIIDMVAVNFRYSDVSLWNNLHLQVRAGQRVQIEGDNGSGKTTLLKIITGELTAFEGSYNRAAFSYFYLDQNYAMIDPRLSIYEQLQACNKRGLDEQVLKEMLVHAQFDPATFDRKCAGLSGGEKMKLSLSCLLVSNQAPDVLILDEPTNNLDIKSLDVLTLAVKNFKGTLLVISHDDYFINEIGIDHRIRLT